MRLCCLSGISANAVYEGMLFWPYIAQFVSWLVHHSSHLNVLGRGVEIHGGIVLTCKPWLPQNPRVCSCPSWPQATGKVPTKLFSFKNRVLRRFHIPKPAGNVPENEQRPLWKSSMSNIPLNHFSGKFCTKAFSYMYKERRRLNVEYSDGRVPVR